MGLTTVDKEKVKAILDKLDADLVSAKTEVNRIQEKKSKLLSS